MRKEAELFVNWVRENCPEFFEAFLLLRVDSDFNRFLQEVDPPEYLARAFTWDETPQDCKYWDNKNADWRLALQSSYEEEETPSYTYLASSYSQGDTLRISISDSVKRIIIERESDD